MAKTSSKVNSSKLCRRILDTKDVVKSSMLNEMVAAGIGKSDIKTLERSLEKVLAVQFDALVEATQSELSG